VKTLKSISRTAVVALYATLLMQRQPSAESSCYYDGPSGGVDVPQGDCLDCGGGLCLYCEPGGGSGAKPVPLTDDDCNKCKTFVGSCW